MVAKRSDLQLEESSLNYQSLNWEIVFGCTLAIIAALLAINDLGGGRYGDDELQLANEKSSAYQWYQSKSIKESLVEGQKDLLTTLLQAEAIAPGKQESLAALNSELGQKVLRYKKEKNEILLGSAAVGKENWAQDVEGEMGKVTRSDGCYGFRGGNFLRGRF